jgi:hypothetical protein
MAVWLPVFPLPLIFSKFVEVHGSITVELIMVPISLVTGSISACQNPIALSLVINEFTLVAIPI